MPRKTKKQVLADGIESPSGSIATARLTVRNRDLIPQLSENKTLEALRKTFGSDVALNPGKRWIEVMARDQETANRAKSFLAEIKNRLEKKQDFPNGSKQLSDSDMQAAIRKVSPSTAEEMPVSDTYPVAPRNRKQAEYMDSLAKHSLVFGIGPAGTGKTFLAIAMAVRALANKLVSKIILTRPLIEADEELGTLPGGAEDKMQGRLVPLVDSLIKIMGEGRYNQAKKNKQIEIVPLGQARGRTFDNAFVVVDEAQNTTVQQMKMILTRIGEPAVMAVNGDATQCDLPRNWKTQQQLPSGLNDAMGVLSELFATGAAGLVAFEDEHVSRSKMAKLVVESYSARDKREKAAVPSPV